MIKTEQIIDAIKHLYWSVIPYDWRPGQMWYRFKCLAWCRWTTVKPRTLPYHTWCDRDALLVHCMFEILDRFLEEECSPGHVNWEATPEHSNAMKEMRSLQAWWHKVYLVERDTTHDEWHAYRKKHAKPDQLPFDFTDAESDRLFKLGQAKEKQLEDDLTVQLRRLIDIKDFMWT